MHGIWNIQIKIAMSVDKLHILIKILAESHMAFDLGDKIDIQWHKQTDQPQSTSSSYCIRYYRVNRRQI